VTTALRENLSRRQLLAIPPDTDPEAAARRVGLRYVASEGPGITRKRQGKGFAYFGTDSKRIRDRAALNRIRSLVIPPAWKSVWICPFENGHIQAVGRDAKGRKQYRYHPRYRAVRDATKFDRMIAFAAALPKIRQQVQHDLSLPGLPHRKVIATVVRLLDETGVRIGNDEYAKQNGSYGLTTFKNPHVHVRGETLRMRFRGKSKQEHEITLHDARVAKIVKQMQELPGQELFHYQLPTGEIMKVDSADVNDYLREVTQADFTAKDFRTWQGTGHVAQCLARLGPAKSAAHAKQCVVQAVKEAAHKLGNRPPACKKYYVHPLVLETYMGRTLFGASSLEALSSRPRRANSLTKLSPAETALLRFLKSNVRTAKHAKAS